MNVKEVFDQLSFAVGKTVEQYVEQFEKILPYKHFLNVDATEYYYPHFLIVILKSVIAGYGGKRFVPGVATVCLLWCNFLFCCVRDMSLLSAVYGFGEFACMFAVQLVCRDWRYHFAFSACFWAFLVYWNPYYQICLDAYVMTVGFCKIIDVYRNEWGTGLALFIYVIAADFFCNQFIVAREIAMTISFLYYPMLFSSLITPRRSHLRFAWVIVCSLFWVLHEIRRAYLNWDNLPRAKLIHMEHVFGKSVWRAPRLTQSLM